MSKRPDVTLASNGGYWQANWTDDRGRRHRKGLGSKATVSRRRAMRDARDWAIQLAERPGLQYGRTPKLGAWVEYFYSLRGPEMKPATITVYRQTTDRLLDHFGPDILLDRIDPVDAAGWHATLPKNPATRAKHSRNAKSLFAWAIKMGMLSHNPFRNCRSNPPVKPTEWHYVSIEDTERILKACPSQPWRAFVALMRFAGLRRGEALRLEWRHIDLDKRIITVMPEGYEGTKQRLRVVPIRGELYPVLEHRRENETPAHGVGPNNIDRDFKVILKHAGLKPWTKLFHTLRQNAGRDWWDHHPAPDVARWMGHSLEVAMRHYGSESTLQMKKATGEL